MQLYCSTKWFYPGYTQKKKPRLTKLRIYSQCMPQYDETIYCKWLYRNLKWSSKKSDNQLKCPVRMACSAAVIRWLIKESVWTLPPLSEPLLCRKCFMNTSNSSLKTLRWDKGANRAKTDLQRKNKPLLKNDQLRKNLIDLTTHFYIVLQSSTIPTVI